MFFIRAMVGLQIFSFCEIWNVLFNEAFNLSTHENIYTIEPINIYYLYNNQIYSSADALMDV